MEGPPKTDKPRTITLPDFLVELLAVHLAAYGTPTDRDSRIFTNANGSPITGQNFRTRHWRRACVAVGPDPVPHVHDLRHTTASVWIQRGANPKVVAELLGHSSMQTPMDRYSHLFENTQVEMAARIDAHWRRREADHVLPGTSP